MHSIKHSEKWQTVLRTEEKRETSIVKSGGEVVEKEKVAGTYQLPHVKEQVVKGGCISRRLCSSVHYCLTFESL